MTISSIGRSVFSLLACLPVASAAVVTVPAGGNLQQAINNASAGDTILLAAGAVFTGNFTLPNKGVSTSYITIASSLASSLPAGQRVNPSNASLMATIVSSNGSAAISADDYANHYQLIGLEVHPAAGVYATDLVKFGSGSTTSLAALPHDLVLDRCYIHGDRIAGSKHGITLNSGTAAVQNSYISDIKSTTQDSSAVAEWNGTGPFTVTNNYLEASGENVLLGGAAPPISGLVPSDITFQGNYLSKPLSWYPKSSTYAGTPWIVKNVFEIKSAKNVNVTGNVLENSWLSSQTGFGIVLTVRTEDGADPTAVVQNVTFQNNLVRNVTQGVNMQGIDDNGMGSTTGVTFRNNVFLVNAAAWGSAPGDLFQIMNGTNNLTIDHNTAIQDSNLVVASLLPSTGFVMQNNMTFSGPYGFFGSGSGMGTAALAAYFPGAIFRNNAIIGANGALYPAGNYFPATSAAVGFADFANGNYALAATSPYIAAATDGKPLGADVAGLQPVFAAALAGTAFSSATSPVVASPVPSPAPSFSPILINAGGPAYTDATGKQWSADMDYSAGASWSVSTPISGTTSPVLYQTCRYASTFSYQIPVPNGNYTVTLKFAEPTRTAAGQRRFNVAINGTPVLTNFDIFAAAGGQFIAVDESFPVSVTGGQISIQLTSGNDWPIISGVQVTAGPTNTPVTTAPAIRINAGGGSYTDSLGQTWSADTGASSGASWAVSNSIANTLDPALFQTCHYGSAFSYTVPVSNGNYTVNLKFAEVSRTAAGQRTFNVALNGVAVLTNFDVFAAVGGEFRAITESFPVSVVNGQVVIQFTAGNDWPLVNAIEIVPR